MKRAFLSIFFAVLLSAAFLATRSEAQPNSVKEVVKGVWFREGDLMKEGHCNNTIIEMKDYLIVVDANFPSGARAALADAQKVSKKPVKYVFDTHHHGDHAYGNAVWTKQGAITLAYVGVAEELKRYEPTRWQQTSKERKDVGDLELATAEPPKETFSKSPHVISDSTRRVEFHFFGWAHTRGDGFVYLPKEEILCTGDAATNGPYNFVADGNVGNWPKVIENAQKLKVKHVLPGHGPFGGTEILAGQRQFMIELHNAAQAALKAGTKPEDAKLPDTVKNWIGPSLKAQLKAAAEEIKQKKPSGDLPH